MAAISYPNPLTPLTPRQPAERHLRLVRGGGVRRHPAPAVYARRRLLALVLAAALVVILFAAAQAVASGLVVQPAPATAPVAPAPAAAVHVVQPGETVWSIARAASPDGDLRATVDRIVARNGGAVIQVGQRLVMD